MTPGEPQSATDYDDRTTAAVKAVLIEIGQIGPSSSKAHAKRSASYDESWQVVTTGTNHALSSSRKESP